MFFYASKIVSALIWPSSVIAVLLLAGAALLLSGRAVRWGRRLLVSGLALLLLCGLSPFGNWLILPLEQRFARPALPDDVVGVILLGGFESGAVARARGEMSINEGGERLTEGLLVARARPRARVIFTGGDGSMLGPATAIADVVGRYLEAAGIEPARIVLEGESRTTWENAIYLARMLKPQPGERYVLVTSAFHMPRSAGTFRKAGFDLVPWPVDFRTRGPADAWYGFATIPAGLERVDIAFKEWVGLAGYWLSGRTAAVWPGPEIAGPSASPAPARPRAAEPPR